MKKDIELFQKLLEKDKNLMTELEELRNDYGLGVLSPQETCIFLNETLIPFAKSMGCNFDVNDYIQYELQGVSGGFKRWPILSSKFLAISGAAATALAVGTAGAVIYNSRSKKPSSSALKNYDQNETIENSNLEEQDSDENILNEKSQNSPKLESNFSESNFNPFLKESNNSPSIISQKSRLTNNLPLRPHLPQINSQSKPPFINNKPPLHPSNIPQEASFLKSKFNPFFKNPNSFSPTIAPKADSINLLPSFSKYHSRVPPFPSQAPPISAKSSNFPKNAPQTQVKVTGLTNKRNMCYLNSALIVIVYNKEFQNLILKLDDSKLNQFPLLKELKQITSNLTKGISCDSVKIASILRLARPGDPSEVFRQFLSKIENEAKKHNDFAEILSFFKKFWGEIGSSGSEQDCNVVPLYPEDTIRHLDERLINHYTTHFKFARPPQILLLHFNRFVNKTTISKEEIIFKNEINVNNNKYVLNSLICNIKTSRGYTHYVVYKLIEGQWYYFDDENVSKTTAGEVLSKTQNCFIFEYVQS